MAPAASHAAAALVRLPPRPAPSSLPQQGFGRAGASLLAVRATKDSDGFRPLVSEKPEWPAPAKREGLDGFGREASNGEEDGQVQGELAPWSLLNQLGVELDSDSSYTALVYGSSAIVAIWTSSIVVSALESVPVVPQVMEVVGLGFTVWFTSRYLIFKENRDELITRIGSIKRQVLGSRDDRAILQRSVVVLAKKMLRRDNLVPFFDKKESVLNNLYYFVSGLPSDCG